MYVTHSLEYYVSVKESNDQTKQKQTVENRKKLLFFRPMKIDRSLISFSFYSAFRSNRPHKNYEYKIVMQTRANPFVCKV